MPPGRAAIPSGEGTKSGALGVPPLTSNPRASASGVSTAVDCSRPTSNPGGLAAGRIAAARPRQPIAAPMTEYEKERVQNILRNNHKLERLGISSLVEIIRLSCANNVEDDGPQKSGSEYSPHDNEGLEDDDEVVSKSVDISSKGTRGSKRVMAPTLQLEPRVTRQRSAATTSLIASTKEALVTPCSPMHTENLNTTAHEDTLTEVIEQRQRGRSMGKGLDRITRGLTSKICIHVSEGKKRPEVPIQAAKLASEAGIVLRQHVPIFPHWKHYKKEENKPEIGNYIGKIAGQFNMDIDNKAVNDACVDLLKGGQRQMRYKLKKKYFNGLSQDQVRRTSPVASMTDAQWLELVAMWSKSEHKDKCAKNKINRDCILYPQCTGSRCYEAQAHVAKQERFKDSSPTAIDLFKEMHCSKKKGFSDQVKQAIGEMESIIAQPIENEEQENTFIKAVAQVLPKNSTFLENMGLKKASGKKSRIDVSSEIEHLQFELNAKTQESAGLREEVDTMSQEIENLKKSSLETNNLLRQLISFTTGGLDGTN